MDYFHEYLFRDMESYAFQDLPPKRIKKLASKFSDEEVRASLREDDDNRAFILDQHGVAAVMYWNAFWGPMAVMDDDSVRAFAQAEYLRRHNYPCFKSYDEIDAYATSHHWPRKKREAEENH